MVALHRVGHVRLLAQSRNRIGLGGSGTGRAVCRKDQQRNQQAECQEPCGPQNAVV